MRQYGTDAIIREAVIRCRVVDHTDAWRGTKRHSQQLMRGRQFGRADFARSVSAFDGDFGEGASFGSDLNALDGAVTKGGTE